MSSLANHILALVGYVRHTATFV